jgi:hypothetical protein
MVTLVSATLVERITLRFAAGSTARSCSAGGRSPCSGSTSRSCCCAHRGAAPDGLANLRRAREKHQHVAVESLVAERRTAEATCAASGRSSARVRCSRADVEAAPLARTRGAGLPGVAEKAATRRRRGWRSSPRRGGRAARALEPSQHREGDVALEVPLVKLVEEHRAHAAQSVGSDEASREDPLGDEANPRPRRAHLLETNLVAPRSRRGARHAPRPRASRPYARRDVRGSSTTTSPTPARPASSTASGARVVLPAPGGASSTAHRRARRA